MNQSGFALQQKSGKILSDQNFKNTCNITSNGQTQITTLICTTTSDKILPPFVLIPRKTLNPRYCLDLPPKPKVPLITESNQSLPN